MIKIKRASGTEPATLLESARLTGYRPPTFAPPVWVPPKYPEDTLPIDCDLFALTAASACHWAHAVGWTMAEAALLLVGACPEKVALFANDANVLKPDYTAPAFARWANELQRASDMGILKFPALPDEVCIWAIGRGRGIPGLLANEMPLPETQPDTVPDRPVVETKEQRQDRRLKACEAAGLNMPVSSLGRLPDGVAAIAKREAVTRQAFSTDVKAALKRREAVTKPGRIVHRT